MYLLTDGHHSWTYRCGSTTSDDKSSKLSEALVETTGEVDVPKGVRSHFKNFACDSCTLPRNASFRLLTVLDLLKAEVGKKRSVRISNCGLYWWELLHVQFRTCFERNTHTIYMCVCVYIPSCTYMLAALEQFRRFDLN